MGAQRSEAGGERDARPRVEHRRDDPHDDHRHFSHGDPESRQPESEGHWQIAGAVGRDHWRVRLVVRKENGGVGAVTSQGVGLAAGEYLIFAQCDDDCDALVVRAGGRHEASCFAARAAASAAAEAVKYCW